MTQQKSKQEKKIQRKRFLTPVRVLLMTVLIFFLSYMTYRVFGVTDFQGWLDEVLMLFLVFALIILAAWGVVAILMFIRKKTGSL